jgi:ABC-type sugar transport system ATPase subunit
MEEGGMGEVVLAGVSKVYPGGVRALEGIDLEVKAGELLVLLGPSGSGKTTLLRLVAGLETPTGGTITIAGQASDRLPPHRRGVGLVSQRAVLYPHLSVRDNLRFGLGRSAEVQTRVREAAAALGIGDLLERRPGELSGGQQQRVALGRAMVRRASVLLLDEPLANLDGPLRWELRGQLHLLQRRLGATMVLVTHEQDEAVALADRLAVLDRGRLAQVGTPQEVLDHPASSSVARLVGWPPINLLPARLRTEDALLAVEGGAPLPALPGWLDLSCREVLLGLRPAHVRVPAGDPSPGEGVVQVQTTLADVQPGPATGYVVLRWGPLTLVGSRASGFRGAGGEAVPAALDLRAAFLFDASTGLALGRG